MRRSGRRDERGAAAVEFALVVVPLLTLLFGIIDFGWIFNQQVSLSNAAREAARYYAVHDGQTFAATDCTGATTWKACAEVWGKSAAPTISTPSWAAAGAGVAVLQGCDSTKPGYSTTIGKSVTATAKIPMPSLTGFFTAVLGPNLAGKGKTSCGG
ncbi:TadE/TadG family type IV pilus assembly protein [Agromyces sp. MMS24-JH15]|uniref:TadE/TadG family type IV pilus assembly protein n=1 Tax=Agromyces sp. MMS24-JH15 TaxID=3243765 RepID=UPI00374816AE